MYTEITNSRQIAYLEELARGIWLDHFRSMIPGDILEMVIGKVQSRDAIADQIIDGYAYFFIDGDHAPVGYFAYKLLPTENELFLSKLYIRASERNKGIGRQVIHYLEAVCRASGSDRLTLTVFHKNTSAIDAYRKLGFTKVGLVERDIGDGIIIIDYQMEKSI